MARDDYFVIVYQILSYLYQCLKKGKDIDKERLSKDSIFFGDGLNERYWKYIIINMYKQGFIEGLTVEEFDNSGTFIGKLENTQITPLGIKYLCDDSSFERAIKFLKDIKEMISFA